MKSHRLTEDFGSVNPKLGILFAKGRKIMKARILFTAFLIAVFCTAFSSYADGPQMINYQGYLTDAAGDPIDYPVDITFRIYDDSTAGNLLWDESHLAVSVEQGVFNVLLGSVDSISVAVFDGDTRYLEIAVDGRGPMTPRRRMVSVPYAIRAQKADEADNDWEISGNNVFTGHGGMYPSGNVGIGTSDPSELLHVCTGAAAGDVIQIGYYTAIGEEYSSGATVVGDNAKPADPPTVGMQIITDHPSCGARAIKMRSDEGITFHAQGEQLGPVTAGEPFSRERMRITNEGRVGIVNADPQATLEVGDGYLSNLQGTIIGHGGSVYPNGHAPRDGVIGIMHSQPGHIVGHGVLGVVLGNDGAGVCGRAGEGGYGVVSVGKAKVWGDLTVTENGYFLGTGRNYFAGKVGIGTTAPTAGLDVKHSSNSEYALKVFNSGGQALGVEIKGGANSATPLLNVHSDYSGGDRQGLWVQSNGNVGIGTTSPSTALEVAGTVQSTSGGFEFPDGTIQTTAAGASVPSGVIVMWSGTLATIPSGWALCDGTSGTPDLRGRFIYGCSAGQNPGGTGGSSSHSHTVDISPFLSESASGSYVSAGDGSWWASDEWHFHWVDPPPTTSNSSNHLPPYYKLAFIMKL